MRQAVSALPPELHIALSALQRLYDERPGALLTIIRILNEPPEFGELLVRFHNGELASVQKVESFR